MTDSWSMHQQPMPAVPMQQLGQGQPWQHGQDWATVPPTQLSPAPLPVSPSPPTFPVKKPPSPIDPSQSGGFSPAPAPPPGSAPPSRSWMTPALACAIFFLLASIALAVALGVVGYRYLHENHQQDITDAVNQATLARTCSDVDPGTNITHPPRVADCFDPFQEVELNQISNFVIAQLNLDTAEPANLVGSDWLFALDFMPAPKASILPYLDGTSTTFEGRYARAIVYHLKQAATARVVEYKVGPIPSFPIAANTPITAIVQSAELGTDIPYMMRPVTFQEYARLADLITATFQTLAPVISGSWQAALADGTISWTDSSPRGYYRNDRTTWIWFYWNLPGMYHLSLGLDMLWNHTSLDPTQWFFAQINYNGQVFNSVNDLVTAYNSGSASFVKLSFPEPTTTDWVNNPLFSSMRRRGPPRTLDTQSLPLTTPQGGKRFGVQGRSVSWMGWNLHLGMTIVGGLVFNDIRFRGDRIVYELALQDAFAGYSGYNPIQATSTYSDAGWGLGIKHFGLIAGVDCPAWATYLDSSFLTQSATATTILRTVCIWEQPDNIGVMRHYDQDFAAGYGFMFVGGYPRTTLMIRTTSTVYNYDYVITLALHLDGTIEVVNAATGYPQGELYPTNPPAAAAEDGYSTRVQQFTMCSLHDHLFGYKVDLDVLGTANTLVRNEVQRVVNNLPYIFPGANTYQKKMVKTPVTTEGPLSGYVYNPTTPTTFAFTNPGAANSGKNAWGNPRSYMIVLPGTVAQLNNPAAPWMAAVQWTLQNVVVTQRKESEFYSSRPQYDMQAPAQPIIHFNNYTDGDSLTQQDLVAWVTVGTVHNPGAEDVPVTSTSTSGINFFIKPSNYYDESPVTDLLNYYYRTGSVDVFPGVPAYSHDLLPDPSTTCFDTATAPEIQ